jgi:hypothetical protein
MRKVSEVTTEQIREATSKGFVASLGYKSVSDTQFDLWLVNERHRIADLAITKERERIIKLLEVTDWLHVCDCGCSPEDTCSARDGIIALIKGENK